MWNTQVPMSWNQIARYLQLQPAGTAMRLQPWQVEHPHDAGMYPSLGMPVGQRASYQMEVDRGLSLAVMDFGQYYDVWIEQRPSGSGLETIMRDNPGSTVAGMAAMGALLGLAFGQSREATLTGAAIGGLAGLCGVAVANAESSPEIAKVATSLVKAMSESAAKPRGTSKRQIADDVGMTEPSEKKPAIRRRKKTTSRRLLPSPLQARAKADTPPRRKSQSRRTRAKSSK